jgi:hypothetical protein
MHVVANVNKGTQSCFNYLFFSCCTMNLLSCRLVASLMSFLEFNFYAC